MPSVSPAAAALAFALCALAVYRLSVLLTIEDGPWALAVRWRHWAIERRVRQLMVRGEMSEGGDDWLTAGLECPWCMSWWLALPAAVTWGVLTGAAPMLVLAAWPAISAVTLVLYRH